MQFVKLLRIRYEYYLKFWLFYYWYHQQRYIISQYPLPRRTWWHTKSDSENLNKEGVISAWDQEAYNLPPFSCISTCTSSRKKLMEYIWQIFNINILFLLLMKKELDWKLHLEQVDRDKITYQFIFFNVLNKIALAPILST